MSISITLPDDAAAFELAAAAQFFTTMAAGRHHYEVNGEFPNFRDAIGPAHVPAVNTVNVTGPTSAEERQAVTAAVEQIASTIAADQFPDVPEFPSAAEAFGSAPPVSQPPPPIITDAAAQIGIPTPPPAAPAGVQLDKHGLPWDARIHSSSKATNADGSWRKRKGLNDDAMVARVEAELRAAQSAPTAASTSPVPQPPPANVVPFVPPPVPSVPPPVAASPSVPAAPAGSAPTTFPAFMQALGPHLASKRVTTEMVNEVLAAHQMPPGLPVLASRPDLIPSVFAGVMQKAGVI